MALDAQLQTMPGLYDDLGPLIQRTTIAMVCISALFLGGRLYSRSLTKMDPWWDDYFCIAGLVCQATFCREMLLTDAIGLCLGLQRSSAR